MKEITLSARTVPENPKQLFDESGSLMLRVKRGELRGELGQPHKQPNQSNEQFAQRVARVHANNISHVVKSLSPNEDGSVTGVCTILDTPSGTVAQKLIEDGAHLKMGLRALVGPDGQILVITFDLIA